MDVCESARVPSKFLHVNVRSLVLESKHEKKMKLDSDQMKRGSSPIETAQELRKFAKSQLNLDGPRLSEACEIATNQISPTCPKSPPEKH